MLQQLSQTPQRLAGRALHAARNAVLWRQPSRQVSSVVARAANIEVDDDALLDMFPTTVKRRINKLKELSLEKEVIDAQYLRAKYELDQAFVDKYAPIFEQRRDVISGKLEVPDYALQPLDDEDAKDEGIPDFWLVALTNNDAINSEISDEDARVLTHLTDITYRVVIDEARNAAGFALDFHFRENPYFKNAVLTKTYMLDLATDMVPKVLEGTKIDWFPGKDSTVRQVKKRVKSKGKVTVVTRQEPVESFFNLFNPPVLPESVEDLDDEELGQLTDEVDRDFELGMAIKELVVMDAVSWFTGEAAVDYGPGEGEDEDEDGEYEEEEEEAPQRPAGRGAAGKWAPRG